MVSETQYQDIFSGMKSTKHSLNNLNITRWKIRKSTFLQYPLPENVLASGQQYFLSAGPPPTTKKTSPKSVVTRLWKSASNIMMDSHSLAGREHICGFSGFFLFSMNQNFNFSFIKFHNTPIYISRPKLHKSLAIARGVKANVWIEGSITNAKLCVSNFYISISTAGFFLHNSSKDTKIKINFISKLLEASFCSYFSLWIPDFFVMSSQHQKKTLEPLKYLSKIFSPCIYTNLTCHFQSNYVMDIFSLIAPSERISTVGHNLEIAGHFIISYYTKKKE